MLFFSLISFKFRYRELAIVLMITRWSQRNFILLDNIELLRGKKSFQFRKQKVQAIEIKIKTKSKKCLYRKTKFNSERFFMLNSFSRTSWTEILIPASMKSFIHKRVVVSSSLEREWLPVTLNTNEN